ncbi:MAG: hypothetical protein ACHQ9S_13190 [Candidatus Binatia bacterium]
MTRGREWLAGAGLAVIGLFLGLAVLEAGVRWLRLVPDQLWEPDPVLGARHKAGKTGVWTAEEREFFVPIQINHEGLRDVEHTYTKLPGVTRLLLLGDSFVEAFQVPLEQTLARRLQALLGNGVEVIGAGVSGYGTASEMLFLKGEGLRYDPDIIVVCFFPENDVENNSPTLEYVLPPVYDSDGRLLRVGAAKSEDVSHTERWGGALKSYRYARGLLLGHPEIMGLLHRLGFTQAVGRHGMREHDGVPLDYWVYAPQPDAEWSAAWQHTERLFTDMRDAVAAAGRQLVVAIVPSRNQIYPELWAETMTAYPAMGGRQWDLAGPAQRLLRWCEAQGVPCVDLTVGFRAAAAGGSPPLHFHHDGHWTAAGHQLAARLVTEFLRAHRIVPAQ